MKIYAAMLVVASLMGCASGVRQDPPQGLSDDQAVTQRAQERWNYLLQGNYSEAYHYMSPAQKAVLSQKSYVGGFAAGSPWVKAKVIDTSCDSPERCITSVDIAMVVVARGFKSPIESTVKETWIKDGGKWWFHSAP